MDVMCVGETMVDFLPEEANRPVRQVELWRRCPGGAVSNVAIGLARLGASAAMVGTLGADEFGTFLLERLRAEKVDVQGLRRVEEGKTGLAFVSLKEEGERSFAFFRSRAADLFLVEADIDAARIKTTRAVHFGTTALLFRDAQRAVLKLTQLAKDSGVMVACDPNVRAQLWPDPDEIRDLLSRLLAGCNIVKLAEDEVTLVTGAKNPEEGLAILHKKGVELPIVTLGAKGAIFLWQDRVVRVNAPVVSVVDSTGAGDGFMAGLLYGLTRLYADAAALRFAGVGELREVVKLACVIGAKTVEAVGAVNGLPYQDQVRHEIPRIVRDAR